MAHLSPEEDLGRMFAKMLSKRSWSPHTMVIGTSTFVILKRFSPAESSAITQGLAKPDTFVFTDLGNVHLSDVGTTYRNPLDTNAHVDVSQHSIERVRREDTQYYFDDRTITSRNLKYILHKQRGRWALLYNPLHSKAFERYYNHSMRVADNVQWGLPSIATNKHLNLRRTVESYCDSLQINRTDRTDGGKSFLDPTCNMVYSDDQCRESSLFDENLVQHDRDTVRRQKNVITQLGAGVPSHCLCTGAPYNYVKSNVNAHSFIHDFPSKPDANGGRIGMRHCSSDLSLTVCNVITEARNLTITGSSLSASCGPGTLESPPPPAPLPPPAPPPPPLPAPETAVPPADTNVHISPAVIVGGLCVGILAAIFAILKKMNRI